MPIAFEWMPITFGTLALLAFGLSDDPSFGLVLSAALLLVGLLGLVLTSHPERTLGFLKSCRARLEGAKRRSATLSAVLVAASVAFAAATWGQAIRPLTGPINASMLLAKLAPDKTTIQTVAQKSTSADQLAVLQFVANWREAWETQNTDHYLGAYSPDFAPADGSTLVAWQLQRLERITRAQGIQLALAEIEVSVDGDKSTVRFHQNYSAANVKDSMRKLMRLTRAGGRWQIIEERAADLEITRQATSMPTSS